MTAVKSTLGTLKRKKSAAPLRWGGGRLASVLVEGVCCSTTADYYYCCCCAVECDGVKQVAQLD